MKKNEKKQPKFATAVNCKRNAGLQGAEKLRQFMLDQYNTDPAAMTKAEKKAFKKMAKELLEAQAIDKEEYNLICEALK